MSNSYSSNPLIVTIYSTAYFTSLLSLFSYKTFPVLISFFKLGLFVISILSIKIFIELAVKFVSFKYLSFPINLKVIVPDCTFFCTSSIFQTGSIISTITLFPESSLLFIPNVIDCVLFLFPE